MRLMKTHCYRVSLRETNQQQLLRPAENHYRPLLTRRTRKVVYLRLAPESHKFIRTIPGDCRYSANKSFQSTERNGCTLHISAPDSPVRPHSKSCMAFSSHQVI